MADISINTMPAQIIGGLYISDIEGVQQGDTSQFDRVISVCQDECSDNVACEYEHFCMADGPGGEQGHVPGEYSYEILTDAIDAVVAARVRRETVCVHCHAGVSRSAAVCIGALAILEGLSYEEALSRVQDTKYIQPTREMLEHVQQYIGEQE